MTIEYHWLIQGIPIIVLGALIWLIMKGRIIPADKMVNELERQKRDSDEAMKKTREDFIKRLELVEFYKKPIHPAAMNMCPVCMNGKPHQTKHCPRCGRHLLLTFPPVSRELPGDADPYKIQCEQFDNLEIKVLQ